MSTCYYCHVYTKHYWCFELHLYGWNCVCKAFKTKGMENNDTQKRLMRISPNIFTNDLYFMPQILIFRGEHILLHFQKMLWLQWEMDRSICSFELEIWGQNRILLKLMSLLRWYIPGEKQLKNKYASTRKNWR